MIPDWRAALIAVTPIGAAGWVPFTSSISATSRQPGNRPRLPQLSSPLARHAAHGAAACTGVTSRRRRNLRAASLARPLCVRGEGGSRRAAVADSNVDGDLAIGAGQRDGKRRSVGHEDAMIGDVENETLIGPVVRRRTARAAMADAVVMVFQEADDTVGRRLGFFRAFMKPRRFDWLRRLAMSAESSGSR